MALLSAVLYGAYAVLMKREIGDERRVNMVVFFGLVGVWNVVLLWPGFFVLHWLGLERWELPPTERVTAIILVREVPIMMHSFLDIES
jgi:solute carrier family 35, member F5